MKAAGPALTAILNGSAPFVMADLWTFTLRNGTVKRYADFDVDLTLSGNSFSSSAVLVTGGQIHTVRGLQVDETDVTCYPRPTETVNGVAFLKAASQGLFDRATVRKERVFMTTVGDTSAGSVLIFLGEVSDCDITATTVVFKVKSMLYLLNINMPRRQYQANCAWVFGDANCTVDRAALAVSTTVTTATASVIHCAQVQAAGFFDQGVLKFTTGNNAGLSKTVKSWTPGVATLVSPFPSVPQAGDAFTLTPGCDKSFAKCRSYNNTIHFGGEPYVPVPETAY